MKNIREIDISSNPITGVIPSSIGALTSLQTLHLGDMKLLESIPSSIGKLKDIRHFIADNNSLTGSIPDELNDLSNLSKCSYLIKNNILLTFISNYDSFGSIQKDVIKLNDNTLVGTIPALYNLRKLSFFDVINNQLSGEIPGTCTGSCSKMCV